MGQSSSSNPLAQFRAHDLVLEQDPESARFFHLYHCLKTGPAKQTKGSPFGQLSERRRASSQSGSGSSGGHHFFQNFSLVHRSSDPVLGIQSKEYNTLFQYDMAPILKEASNSKQTTQLKDEILAHFGWCRSLRHPNIVSYLDSSLTCDENMLSDVKDRLEKPHKASLKDEKQSATQSNLYLLVKGALIPFVPTTRSSSWISSLNRHLYVHQSEMALVAYELAQTLHWLNTELDIVVHPDAFRGHKMSLFFDSSETDVRKRILLGNLSWMRKKEEGNAKQDLDAFESYLRHVYQERHMEYPEVFSELLCGSESTLVDFLESSYFQNDAFIRVMLGLDTLPTKNHAEKSKFFTQLFDTLKNHMDYELVKQRIVPRLISERVLIEPHSVLFLQHLFRMAPTSNILKSKTKSKVTAKGSPVERTKRVSSKSSPHGLLHEDDYRQLLVPFIQSHFKSDSATIRTRLLQSLPFYIPHLSPSYIHDSLISEIAYGLKDNDEQMTQFSATALMHTIRYLHASHTLDSAKMKQCVHYVMRNLYHYATKDVNVNIRSHCILTMTELFGISYVDNNLIYSAIKDAVYDPVSSEIKIHVLNVILMHQGRFDQKFLTCCIFGMVAHLLLHEEAEIRGKARQVLTSLTKNINVDGENSVGIVTQVAVSPYIALQQKQRPEDTDDPHKRPSGSPSSNAKTASAVHEKIFKGRAPKLLIGDTASGTDVGSIREKHLLPSGARESDQSAKSAEPKQSSSDSESDEWDEEFEDWEKAKPMQPNPSSVRNHSPASDKTKDQKKNDFQQRRIQQAKPKSLNSLKRNLSNKKEEEQEEQIPSQTTPHTKEEEEDLENVNGWVDFDLDAGAVKKEGDEREQLAR